MLRLSVDDIIARIRNEEIFEAVADDYSFTLKISDYTHYMCGAVHDGHQFRKDLWAKCLHSEYDRWYEEDPCTRQMVQTMPIVIAGCDSRFEYDLNREPERAIYEDAWGKKLWNSPLTATEKSKSLDKHERFYEVVHALVEKLEQLFGSTVVYDMHSYNWKRWQREVPVWNLGTSNIDNQRFGNEVDDWKDDLSGMQLPNGISATAAINDTFQGNGYFLKYITNNFDDTLVLATEISKVYCDELSGVIYPEVVAAVERQLKQLLPTHAAEFYEKHADNI